MYLGSLTRKKSASMQTMGGGGSEGTEAIPIHQLHQRSELIMLSHMWTLSLTASKKSYYLLYCEVQWLRTIVEY